MFVHTLTIQRNTPAGAPDEYNQTPSVWADLATVQGLVQPKGAREKAQLNQAGTVSSDYSIHLPLSTDVDEADRIVYAGETYQVEGIERRPYGGLAHIRLNASKVTV